jgi:glycosyltransferase involved in cell wall biosynthesis
MDIKPSGYRIYAATMIRNDADLVLPFLAQAEELFDSLLIVDVQSTDGTTEAIASFAATKTKINLYSIDKQEKYQSAIMNYLARAAFDEGADWLFFLDADEYINVDSRGSLEHYLKAFPHDVMHLPWINLVPTHYGTFASFDVSQDFFWRGRTSKFNKIALSNLFIANNPDFYISEGNHTVARDFTSGPLEMTRDGLTLLHLPIRSLDRFKYKMVNARRTLLSKHNRKPGEGSHVLTISDLIEDGYSLGDCELNSIAAHYGDSDHERDVDPKREGWPTIKMQQYVLKAMDGGTRNVSLAETLLKDGKIKWAKSDFVKGSVVGAVIEGGAIKIKPQPMRGNGNIFHRRYAALPPAGDHDATSIVSSSMLIDAINASFMRVKFLAFSAWSELIPTLFCIFSIARPRRFVELGTHNGMSFFGACQATAALSLDTQCIAIDNWIGDPHASFHSSEIFDHFSANIRNNFPDQFYIRAHFHEALECFENESIDLLHIDGFHTYAAVKDDFETWLPKMSQRGIILFHDINVHEREFGVWRLWNELKDKYPSFDVFHCHGLGVICVGPQPSIFADILELLRAHPEYKDVVRALLESIGRLSIESRKNVASLEDRSDVARLNAEIAVLRRNQEDLNAEIAVLQPYQEEVQRLRAELGSRDAQISELKLFQHALLNSTSWRVTRSLRLVKRAFARMTD